MEDTEEFCRRILDRALDSWSMFLREAEYDDTLMELIAQVWKLEGRYDPDKAASFTAYATWIVSQRAVDYGPRRILGRHGTRTNDYMSPHENPYDERTVGETLDRFIVDDQEDRDSNVAGILSERDSEIAEYENLLGLGQTGIFETGDQGS